MQRLPHLRQSRQSVCRHRTSRGGRRVKDAASSAAPGTVRQLSVVAGSPVGFPAKIPRLQVHAASRSRSLSLLGWRLSAARTPAEQRQTALASSLTQIYNGVRFSVTALVRPRYMIQPWPLQEAASCGMPRGGALLAVIPTTRGCAKPFASLGGARGQKQSVTTAGGVVTTVRPVALEISSACSAPARTKCR